MTSMLLVQDELATTLGAVDPTRIDAALDLLADRHRRWFASGQGRSRLVASMAAMRLMHLGYPTHLVGETTAPSIQAGDGLLMLSASGETPRHPAPGPPGSRRRRHHPGRHHPRNSTLGGLADTVVPVPVKSSQQFGGSLFEQSALLLLDSLILDLTRDDPGAYQSMQHRHTNLE